MVYGLCGGDCFLFFKQKTAYELRISDWSSDVCSSDLTRTVCPLLNHGTYRFTLNCLDPVKKQMPAIQHGNWQQIDEPQVNGDHSHEEDEILQAAIDLLAGNLSDFQRPAQFADRPPPADYLTKRSEEHTSELQSLMRISYAVFCLKKKNTNNKQTT